MDVIGVQLDIAWEEKGANHRRVRSLLGAANVSPGSLVVLPEMFSTGFSMDVSGIQEGAERTSERFLASLASEWGCTVLGGVVTRAPDGRGRNECVVFGPDGAEIARYQKIHPFTYGGETKLYEPGRSLSLFDWNGFRVAPFICYDLRFPEIFRLAVRQGANLFAVIANWPQAREEHWISLLKARAIENQAYVAGINRWGRDPKVAYSGRSLIIDPRGLVMADGGEGEGVIRSQPDIEALHAYRDRFPALQDMHDEYFP